MGLGVFQLWMVPSTPPLKHCSPLELMVTHSTAPLHRGGRVTTRSRVRRETRRHLSDRKCLNRKSPVGSERVDGFHVQRSAPGGLKQTDTVRHPLASPCSTTSRIISLLGRRRLLEVPQFEGLVLGGRDQDRLHRVEGQTADRVEVASQGELWVPGLPQSVLVVGDLKKGNGGAGLQDCL